MRDVPQREKLANTFSQYIHKSNLLDCPITASEYQYLYNYAEQLKSYLIVGQLGLRAGKLQHFQKMLSREEKESIKTEINRVEEFLKSK